MKNWADEKNTEKDFPGKVLGWIHVLRQQRCLDANQYST